MIYSLVILSIILAVFLYIKFFKKIKINELIKIIQKNDCKSFKKILNRIENINSFTTFIDKKVKIEKASILMIAIYYNVNLEIIKNLIIIGANVNIKDENKNTPLLYAALYYNNPEIIDLLINSGADINNRNILGANAVMIALYNNNIEVFDRIIKRGGDVNCQNNGGWSSLMSIAFDFRPLEMAKKLVENGSDVNLKNKLGKSAFDIANELGNQEMLNFLNSLK